MTVHQKNPNTADLEAVRDALQQTELDLSYYVHLATKFKTNNKWIDCEVYKIEMSIDRLVKALSTLNRVLATPRIDDQVDVEELARAILKDQVGLSIDADTATITMQPDSFYRCIRAAHYNLTRKGE